MRYDDALRMADIVMTYRPIVKEIARAHGCDATFRPKPLSDDSCKRLVPGFEAPVYVAWSRLHDLSHEEREDYRVRVIPYEVERYLPLL